MNEIQVFNNPEFGNVRTLDENGTVLFCGSDVAKALGYQNPSRDVQRHCKAIEVRYTTDSVGRQKEMLFILESDLYRLVFSSKLPTAEKFTDWVTSDVLPTIRKHGAEPRSTIQPMDSHRSAQKTSAVTTLRASEHRSQPS